MQDTVRTSFNQGKPPSMIFSLMILTNILINLDHGILPACTTQLQTHFSMNQTQLGFLGSIVYLGISIMGLFAGRLYQHFHSKLLTVVALIMLELSLLLFVLSDHKWSAYVSRFATGVCQVFLLVYYPIWIDKFGGEKKTFWLTLLQICVPVGIFVGYGMTAVIISTGNSYRLSFYIQVGVVTLFILAFLFLGREKLDSRRRASEDMIETLIDGAQWNNHSPNQLPSQQTLDADKEHKYKFKTMLGKLAKSKMYLVGTFTMAVILYVSTGIQFWLTKYLIDVLGNDEGHVYIAYAVVSITGPTTGCAFGGYMVNRIGGYEHPHTVFYVFVFSIIGIGSAVIIPFVDNFIAISVLLWIVLYFGGAMMPGLTGIMMCSVSPYLRAFGNSTGEIIKNVFGYLPSPFVYGMFNTLLGNRAGIKFLMFWGVWAPILLGLGSIHKYNQIKRHKLAQEQAKNGQSVIEDPAYSDESKSTEEQKKSQEQRQRERSGEALPQQTQENGKEEGQVNAVGG